MSWRNCSNWGREKGVRGESGNMRCESKSMHEPRPPPHSQSLWPPPPSSLPTSGGSGRYWPHCPAGFCTWSRGGGRRGGCSFLPRDGWPPQVISVSCPRARGTGDFLQLVVMVSRAERGPRPLCLKVVLPVCTLPREGLLGGCPPGT